MEIEKVAIVGLGKMGSALASALVKEDYQLHVHEISDQVINKLKPSVKNNIQLHNSLESLAREQCITVIAVKPKQVEKVIRKIQHQKAIISIAAGISIQQLEQYHYLQTPPIIRAMPNIPFMIGKGVTCYCANSYVPTNDIVLAENILAKGGKTFRITDENELHAITALSGSGPALVYTFLQTLEDAGVLHGLSREFTREILTEMVLGSIALSKKSHSSYQDLINDITSPGGTTITALANLKKPANFEYVLYQAINSAVKHSKNME